MAQKRMFDKTITNSDNFLEMPDSTQNLYFHLSMEADDDGFVDNWKSIMRMTGKKEDDLKILIAKQYIIPFDTGVIVIKHWRINNYLRKDRYHETKYLKEKEQLFVEENQEYSLNYNLGIPCGNPEENRIEENRIEKNRIEKNRIEKNIYEFVEENFGRTLNQIEYEEISKWEDNELTRYAIRESILNGARSINYIRTVIDSFKAKDILTIEEAIKDKERYKKNKENKSKSSIDRFNDTLDEWAKQQELEEELNNDNFGS